MQYQFGDIINFFKQALLVDSIRGMDSTGVAAVDIKGKLSIKKQACVSANFITQKNVESFITDHENVLLCGHNRAATKGSIDNKSAHPFRHGDITMFHNGTLWDWKDLEGDRKFDIDSEAIAYSLSINGVIKTLEKVDGAYALVWYDEKRDSLNFARNEDRPLHIATIKNSTSMLYASEKGMIEWLAARNNIELEEIKPLSVGKHLEIPLDLDKEIVVQDFKVMEDYDWTKYTSSSNYGYSTQSYAAKNYKYPSPIDTPEQKINRNLQGLTLEADITTFNLYNTGGGNSATYGSLHGMIHCSGEDAHRSLFVQISGINKEDSQKIMCSNNYLVVKVTSIMHDGTLNCLIKKKQNTPLNLVPKEKANVTPLLEHDDYGEVDFAEPYVSSGVYVKGPGNIYIAPEKFEELTKHGCANCTTPLDSHDAEKITWVYSDEPVCPDCALLLGEAIGTCGV